MHKLGHTTKLLTTIATAFVVATGACGDDDSTTATTAAPATAASATTTGAGGGTGVAAFCDGELAAEKAANTDLDNARPAFEALVTAAPADIKATVRSVTEHAQQGPGSPAFDEPYGKMISYMKGNCGFNDFSAIGSEYKYEDFPTSVESGKTVVTFRNKGNEFHELAIIRVKDGVTDTAEDILSLSEREVGAKAEVIATAFAPPEATSSATADLPTGRYIFACFLPVGATPETMEKMNSGEATLPADTKTHWMSGMVEELTVS